MINVTDNFCDEKYFQFLQDIFVRPNNKFAWFYHNAVNGNNDTRRSMVEVIISDC